MGCVQSHVVLPTFCMLILWGRTEPFEACLVNLGLVVVVCPKVGMEIGDQLCIIC